MADRSIVWLAALFAIQVSALWYPTPDTVRYLSMARSFARDFRFTDLGSPVLSFPPGYPLVLSPTFLWSERPFLAISLVHLGLVIAFLVGVRRWAARVAGEGGFAVTALVAVNVSLWIHFRRPLSEIAFMAATVWMAEALHGLRVRPPTWRHLWVVASGAALLPQIREIGVAVLAGFAGLAAVEARRGAARSGQLRRATVLLLVSLLSVAAFVAYDHFAKLRSPVAVGTHLDAWINPPMPHLEWAMRGLVLRTGEIGRLVVPLMALRPEPQGWLDRGMILHLPAVALIALGWLRLLRSGDVLAAALPSYLAVYVAWGFDAGTRYMLPMLPVFAASLWIAGERRPRLRGVTFRVLVAAHLVVALGHWWLRDLPFARACDALWPRVDALAVAQSDDGVTPPATPECVGDMLLLRLDRVPDPEKPAGQPTPEAASW